MPFKFIFRLSFLLFFFQTYLSAQQTNLFPSVRDVNIVAERQINNKDNFFHSAFKPYVYNNKEILNIDNIYQVFNAQRDKNYIDSRKNKLSRYLLNKLLRENLFIIKDTGFLITIDPLFNFQIGKVENNSKQYITNTRGALIKGQFGKRFSFESNFYENQSSFQPYLESYIKSIYVVPGQGTTKILYSSFDYSMASGKINYSINKNFNIQFGHGKNFIGEGYRSLLISDNSYNYPFLLAGFTNKRFQYISMVSAYQDLSHYYKFGLRWFQKKYSTINYLSYNINKSFNIGLFESVVWRTINNDKPEPLKAKYFNPLMFSNTLIARNDSMNNCMLGLNLKWKVNNKNSLYFQFVLDNFYYNNLNTDAYDTINKYGYQIGIKCFDFLWIPNLYFQTEYNAVLPYTYSQKNTLESYTNLKQPLAHPTGANFTENFAVLNYRYKDFIAELKVNYIEYGNSDRTNNYGNNPIRSDSVIRNYNPEMLLTNFINGSKTYVTYTELRLAYVINHRTNLLFEVSATDRKETTPKATNHTLFIFAALKTSLMNIYYDF